MEKKKKKEKEEIQELPRVLCMEYAKESERPERREE